MLSWRRIALLVIALVAAKSVIALLAAHESADKADSFTPSPEFQHFRQEHHRHACLPALRARCPQPRLE